MIRFRTLLLLSLPFTFLLMGCQWIHGGSGASSKDDEQLGMPLVAGKSPEVAAAWDGEGERQIALRAGSDSAASVGYFSIAFADKGMYSLLMTKFIGIETGTGIALTLFADSTFQTDEVAKLKQVGEETVWDFDIPKKGTYYMQALNSSKKQVACLLKLTLK